MAVGAVGVAAAVAAEVASAVVLRRVAGVLVWRGRTEMEGREEFI